MKDLTKGSPAKVILQFALPVLIGQLLQLCYSLADTRIVSTLLGEQALSAVGATSALSALLVSLLTNLANGFAIIVARYFGANNEDMVKRTVAWTFGCSILLALAISTGIVLGMPLILHGLHTPDEIYSQARQYISIVFGGAVISILYNSSAAVLRAIGDTVTPVLFLLLSVILNIAGDFFCIQVLHLGVAGAAIATVAAQLIAMVACVTYMWKRYELLRIGRADFRKPRKIVQMLLGCGLSMGLMGCIVNIGSVCLQMGINSLGQDIIVAHTAARKISEIFMLMFGVLGSTMATYSSQNYGAGCYERIRTGLKQVLLIGWCWCALVLLLSYTLSPALVRMVTGTVNAVVLENASYYLKVDTLFYVIPVAIAILRNTLQGIGDHTTPIVSSGIECVGKVLIVFLLVPPLGYFGIILAEPIVWIIMVIPLIIQIVRNPVMRHLSDSDAVSYHE